MAFHDPNIDATNAELLLEALGNDAIDGTIMAARMLNDGHPPTVSTDVAPASAPNGGVTVDADASRITQAVTNDNTPETLQTMKADKANVLTAAKLEPDASPDLVADAPKPDLPSLEPPKPWDTEA